MNHYSFHNVCEVTFLREAQEILPFAVRSVNSVSMFCVAPMAGQYEFQILTLLTHVVSTNDCVTGSNFEITFVSEKHVVEDDVLFTNHLEGK